jgi:heme exporter protein D
MNWNSPAEFFAMGGHGLYVWGSFGACLVAMVVEPLLVGKRRSEILHTLRRERIADELDKTS